MPFQPLDNGDRWWSWDGHTIDLCADPGYVPASARLAILAHRDAETDEDRDMAELLTWLVENHPPWRGGCATCRTSTPCTVQRNAESPATSWLIDRTQRLLRDLTRRTTRALRRHHR